MKFNPHIAAIVEVTRDTYNMSNLKVIFMNFLFVLVFSVTLISYGAEMGKLLEEEDLELENQLKVLNKPAIKTIFTQIGDIFDCVDINKQPAFDHPLLKNHKIQMEPELLLDETINKVVAKSGVKVSKSELELHSERCPSGTVPIRRTTKADLVNAKYISKQIKPYDSNIYPVTPIPYHILWMEPILKDKIYYGGKATINEQNPRTEADQFSTAQIWIQNGPSEERNSIETGWAVYPLLFGDNVTRLFGYWTADGYKNKGCFNMLCSGFVQVHPVLALSMPLKKISVYGGVQSAIIVMVYREALTGNWWLIHRDNIKVGYWPNELFTHLANNASTVKYGGIAGAKPNRPTPPLGNGHLPNQDYSKACFMAHMKIVNKKGKLIDFDPSKVQKKQSAAEKCYDLEFNGYAYESMELSMTFGGPGGLCA